MEGTPPQYTGHERRDDITKAQLPSLEALRRFVVVAEELSFTKAARRLHVVQSGVSSVIAALERELGATLFDRDRHAVALTEAGRALLPEARATLAAAQAAADAVAETTAGLRGTLRVGTMISTGAVDVSEVLSRFHRTHPGVAVRLRQAPGGSADLARAVADGSLDLALLSLPGEPPAEVEVRQLEEEPMVLICAAGHPLAGSPGVSVGLLGDETFVDFPVGWGTRAITDRAFAAAGVERQVAFEVANYGTAASLVGNGLGIAFVPASAAAEMPEVAQVTVDSPAMSWRIQVATAASHRPSAAARAFLEELVICSPDNQLHGSSLPSRNSLLSVPVLAHVSTSIETRAGSAATQDSQASRYRRHNVAFWIVGYAFAVTMAFSALPTPLYVLYQARDHFSTFMITVIFAAYAVGVMASLFLAGHLSDWVGRRRMVLLATATNMFSGVLFLAWPATAGLIVARVVSGVSIGMLTATATAYLNELHAAARPGAGSGRSEIVATAANLGGIGLGPLLAGLLAAYAGHALVIPYLVAEALMLAGALALAAAPETANVLRGAQRPAYRPQRVSVPAAHRPRFLAATVTGGAVFALFGLFTSVSPSLLADVLHNKSHAVAGVVAFAVFGAAGVAQILLGKASRRTQVGAGIAAVLAGLALVTASVWLPSFWLLLAGGIVAGAGAGIAFRGVVATVISITPPSARGEGLAGLFLGAYIGVAIPVVGLGVATLWVSLPVSVLGLTVALAAVIIASTRRLLLQ